LPFGVSKVKNTCENSKLPLPEEANPAEGKAYMSLAGTVYI
jgi:hypothetical protein